MTAVLVILVCVAAVAGAVGGFFVKLTKSSCWGVTVLLALICEGIIGAAVKKTSSGYGLALLISTVVVAVVFMCVFGVLKKLLYKAAEARRQLSHYKNYDDKEENEELILAAVDSGDKRQYKKQLKKGKRIKDSAGVWGFIDRIRALETENAVQNAHWKNVDSKLDDLTAMVRELSGKAGKRWDKAVETILVAIVTGVVCFLLGRLGL